MQKISRSGVEKYLGCPRCFVLQYKYKVSLSQIPFTLNSAVDELCKNEDLESLGCCLSNEVLPILSTNNWFHVDVD